MKVWLKKLGILTLAAFMCATLVLDIQAEEETETSSEDSIQMPIVLLDHQNDGLLFEYNLSNPLSASLALASDPYEGVANVKVAGLSHATRNGVVLDTPYYTQASVDYVANLIYAYLSDTSIDTDSVNNERLNTLYHQLAIPSETKYLWNNNSEKSYYSASDLGWDTTGFSNIVVEDGELKFYDLNGNLAWYTYGDGDKLYGNVTDTAVSYTYHNLSAGTYYLAGWDNVYQNVTIQLINGEQTINVSELNEITVEDGASLTIRITSNLTEDSTENAYIWAIRLCKKDSNSVNISYPKDNGSFVESDNLVLTLHEGLKANKPDTLTALSVENSTNVYTTQSNYESTAGYQLWRYSDYDSEHGSITSSRYADPNAAYDANIDNSVITETYVGSGNYKLDFINELGRLLIEVLDENGEKLEQTLSGQGNEYSLHFTVSQPQTIKVKISQDPNQTEPGYRKASAFKLIRLPAARLGSYEDSVALYGDYAGNGEVTQATLSNATTCYDYAYYMLNNYWNETADVTKKVNTYQTLTLVMDDETNLYTINAQNPLLYDQANGTVKNDSQGDVITDGFFPVDYERTNDVSQLFDDPQYDGETVVIDEVNYRNQHNFHYAMSAKTAFLWSESDQETLTFDFYGDDDVYVFINDHLALDLGGAHQAYAGQIVIHEDGRVSYTIGENGEEVYVMNGDSYFKVNDKRNQDDSSYYNTLKFFYMERHTTASGMRIETNIVEDRPEVTGDVKYTDQDGNEINNGSSLPVGSDVNISYQITAKSRDMFAPSILDTYFELDTNAGTIQLKNGAFIKDKLTLTKQSNSGIQTIEISADQINNADVLNELKNWMFQEDDVFTVTGISKKVTYDTTLTSQMHASLTSKVATYQNATGTFSRENVVKEVEDSIMVYPTFNPSISVNVKLTDENDNLLKNISNKELDNHGFYQNEAGKVLVGTDVYVTYEVMTGFDSMHQITLVDESTGLSITPNGIAFDFSKGYQIKEALTITIGDQIYTISAEELENGLFTPNTELYNALNQVYYPENTQITISGIYKNLGTADEVISPNVTSNMLGPVPFVNDLGEYSIVYANVDGTDRAKVVAAQKSTIMSIFTPSTNNSTVEPFPEVVAVRIAVSPNTSDAGLVGQMILFMAAVAAMAMSYYVLRVSNK